MKIRNCIHILIYFIFFQNFKTSAQTKWIGVWDKNFIFVRVYSIDSDSILITKLFNISKKEGAKLLLCAHENRDTIISYKNAIRNLFISGKSNDVEEWMLQTPINAKSVDSSEFHKELLPDGYWSWYLPVKDTFLYWKKQIKYGYTVGDAIVYDPLEKTLETYEFNNSKIDGFYTCMINNKLRAIYYYVDGIPLNGRIYYDNGKLQISRKSGGYLKFYNDDGKQLSEMGLDSSMKYNGISRGWDKNGKINEFGRYLHGDRDGIFYFYNSDGSIKKKERWENGKLIE